jgi:hypothetical protein
MMHLGELRGRGSGVGVVLVFGVAGGFELEGAVLHIGSAGQTRGGRAGGQHRGGHVEA